MVIVIINLFYIALIIFLKENVQHCDLWQW